MNIASQKRSVSVSMVTETAVNPNENFTNNAIRNWFELRGRIEMRNIVLSSVGSKK